MNLTIDLDIIKLDLLKNISNKYNISYEDLLNELTNITQFKTVKSKYSCDHFFFSKDNELSFYWAGFIAADGCVFSKSKETKTLNISLAEKDLSHIIRFKNDILFDGKIYSSITKRNHPIWKDSKKNTIKISSIQIFEDLKRFNIVPNKTKTYTFPQWLITHPLANHFMRGYIDGDGSFFMDKHRNRLCFELRGTYEFLETYKNILENNMQYKSNVKITTPDSTSKIKYTGQLYVHEVINFLYNNSTIYLQRKYNIAKSILNIDLEKYIKRHERKELNK